MFTLKYEALEKGYGYIHIIVNGQDISEYSYNGNIYYGMCRISKLLEWINDNLKYIISDDPFPVKTNAKTGADMWLYSDDYIPGNYEHSLKFQEKRQNWIWHHSIDSCKDEFCMPFIVFCKVGDNMEITWNNIDHNYKDVEFRYKYGVCYLNLNDFKSELYNFIKRFN